MAAVTAILTCFNRREQTLTCLRSYFAQEIDSSLSIDAVLVDDHSSDGTAAAVRKLDCRATVIESSGDLYWAGGMALAEKHAFERPFDFLLWLNDDVVLDPDALARLLAVFEAQEAPCIVVGAQRDPDCGDVTYSGVRRHRIHPLRFDRIEPGLEPLKVDTFNGNTVLVPRSVALALGPIDGGFEHASADFDYGMRATKAGVSALVAPGTVGTCPRDHPIAPWLDNSIPARERVRLAFERKGMPPRSRARYLRRHGGALWPVFWLSGYVKFGFSLLRFARPGRHP